MSGGALAEVNASQRATRLLAWPAVRLPSLRCCDAPPDAHLRPVAVGAASLPLRPESHPWLMLGGVLREREAGQEGNVLSASRESGRLLQRGGGRSGERSAALWSLISNAPSNDVSEVKSQEVRCYSA